MQDFISTIPNYIRSLTMEHGNQVTPRLWIGNRIAARDPSWLSHRGITHIINCTSEIPNYFQNVEQNQNSQHSSSSPSPRLHYLKLGLQDSTDISDDLLAVLETSYGYMKSVLDMSPHTKILVHCAAGISRSASIVIYYLMRENGMEIGSFDRALAHLKSRRDIVRPNTWYTQQLRDAERLANAKLNVK